MGITFIYYIANNLLIKTVFVCADYIFPWTTLFWSGGWIPPNITVSQCQCKSFKYFI